MPAHLENAKPFRHQVLRQTCGQVVTPAGMVMPQRDAVDRSPRLTAHSHFHNIESLQTGCLFDFYISQQDCVSNQQVL